MTTISRRDALAGAAGLSAFALGGPSARAAMAQGLDLNDPVTALRTHVKLVGSLGTGPVYTFFRLNLYGDPGEGSFVPMFTMNNVLVDYWEAKPDNQHEMRKYEVGYYTKIDSNEPLEFFDNPITGKRVPVHFFRLGPVPRLYTPEGVIVMGYNPNPLPLEVIGDRVFLATQSIETTADVTRGGAPQYVNSFMTYSALVADVVNPAVLSAAVHAQLANKNRWQHWMGMGDLPGHTVARGYGAKVSSLEALPPGVMDGLKRFVPEILDTKNWTEFVFEDSEYLKSLE